MKRSTFCIFLCLFTSMAFAQGNTERLFHIERNKDKDVICYDLYLQGENIDKEKFMHVYWLRHASGKIDELSSVQFDLAFGYTISNVSDKSATFIMKAYHQRPITVSFEETSKQYYAQITINGKPARLEKLYVYADPPLYVTVPYLELYGKDLATNNDVYEKIIPKKENKK